MANASVEKFKALGLRHGEKAVVGITAAVCLMFLYMAATRPTIETTPEKVREAASRADSNLNKRQEPADILKLLEEAKIVNPNFEKMVDSQASNKIDPIAFRVTSPWSSPEPGAGLIRDTPELIAPTELLAYPGRGGALVYELKDGERVPVPPDDPDAPKGDLPQARLNRRMSMGSEGLMGGGMSKKQQEEANKKYEAEKKRVARLLAGKDKAKADAATKEEKPAGPFTEVTKGLRWVSITGVLDYKALRENYLTALKRSEVAYPHFKQVDIERQILQEDGSWSDWELCDAEQNDEILDNLPEHDEEWVPDPMRFEALVDPLPFLQAGYWEKVHVVSLVPKEKKEVAKPQMSSMMPGMEGMSSDMGMMMPQEGMMMNSSEMGMPGMMMEGGMGMGGPADDMSFLHNEEETIMVRALDFTVEPDTTYRFRLRIVVFNPNRNREDVAPGVDKAAIELAGPWSEPTEVVSVPADVATYALQKVASVGTSDQVQFEVTKWDSGNGVMVTKKFDAGPGDIIGVLTSVEIPSSDGSGTKRSKIDFNSRQVVLDAMGGTRSLPKEIENGKFDVPAISLVVRPDGSVATRNQSFDEPNEVRKNIGETYLREVKESNSNKVRESSSYFSSGMP